MSLEKTTIDIINDIKRNELHGHIESNVSCIKCGKNINYKKVKKDKSFDRSEQHLDETRIPCFKCSNCNNLNPLELSVLEYIKNGYSGKEQMSPIKFFRTYKSIENFHMDSNGILKNLRRDNDLDIVENLFIHNYDSEHELEYGKSLSHAYLKGHENEMAFIKDISKKGFCFETIGDKIEKEKVSLIAVSRPEIEENIKVPPWMEYMSFYRREILSNINLPKYLIPFYYSALENFLYRLIIITTIIDESNWYKLPKNKHVEEKEKELFEEKTGIDDIIGKFKNRYDINVKQPLYNKDLNGKLDKHRNNRNKVIHPTTTKGLRKLHNTASEAWEGYGIIIDIIYEIYNKIRKDTNIL